MRYVALSQRVEAAAAYDERRDALDQRWPALLAAAGLRTIALPNDPVLAIDLLHDLPLAGLILTGGNSLGACGGDAPDRDRTEQALLAEATTLGLPVLGVCRGMQLLQSECGVALEPVAGQVQAQLPIAINGEMQMVNSYHDFGARNSAADLEVWARGDDGVVKAVRHRSRPWLGIMWHPERIDPFRAFDLDLLRTHFEAQAPCAR